MTGLVGSARPRRRTARRPARGAAATALGIGLLLACALALGTAPARGAYLARVVNTTNTAATATYFTCAAALAADQSTALFVWPLTETSGTSAADVSGRGNAGTYRGTLNTTAVTGGAGCPRDPGTAYSLNGSNAFVSLAAQQANPTTFSLEVWFRTLTASGKLIGFGSSATGASASFDRHIYLNTAGRLVFGVYPTLTYRTLVGPTVVTDGNWHQVVVTFSAGTGSTMYLDGKPAIADATMTGAQTTFGGYWRLGYDAQTGWPGAGTNPYFTGSMRYAAVFTSVLSAAQVAQHYTAGS